jgi:hypothetical protein
MEEGTGRAIVISLVDTNSTDRLAVLDGMILTGQVEFQPDETGLLTLWEWQSGIPLPTGTTTATTPTEEPSLLTDATTTNATTTADDTNTATADEVGGEEQQQQQQQQQQTTPTVPPAPAPNPLFE